MARAAIVTAVTLVALTLTGCDEGVPVEEAPDAPAAATAPSAPERATTTARPSGSALAGAKRSAENTAASIEERQAELQRELDRQNDPD